MVTIKQHTSTPKGYLKSFGEEFFVFSKVNNVWENNKRHRKSISVINNWYEHSEYEINEIENFLGKIENDWAKTGRDKLLISLKDNDYILTEADKKITAKFIWLEITRTRQNYRELDEIKSGLIEYLTQNNATNELINEFSVIDEKKTNLELIKNDTPEGSKKLIECFHWEILKTSDSMHKFILSDNPIIKIGSHLEHNYIIVFILSPKIAIRLVDKENTNSDSVSIDRIKHINSQTIIYYNRLQIYEAYDEIYATTSREKNFINKTIKQYPETLIINRNRFTLSEYVNPTNNTVLLVGGKSKPKIKK